MKHVRTFEKYRLAKHKDDSVTPEVTPVEESVLQVDDMYKVKTMIDVPQSLINGYVKKVKDTTGKNIRQFFGDVDLAEELVKYVMTNFLDIEKIPGDAILGGQTQAQAQGAGQVQVQTDGGQAQAQAPAQMQPQAQMQAPAQAQAPVQGEMDGFEDPQIQMQGQGQPQAQMQGQPQAQGQDQIQGQDEDEDEDTDELPL